MLEKTKEHGRGFISEEDISSLLQRYSATEVLALLQEVAQYSDAKLDWDALVQKTTTGISNAREYQMLWRHLAYRDSLTETQDGALPLDDDSDLEYELEAFPHVSTEASSEAAACVKVLIASGLPCDCNLPNSSTVEAPLTINIPNDPSFRSTSEHSQTSRSMRGVNITVPVSVQKQPLPATTANEGLDANGSVSGTGSLPPRRKRKPWSEAEDLELIAAVEKCGEGNWANILKGDFKSDRTASQLSQRWAIIRKRRNNLNAGANHAGAHRTESQLAATHAANHAMSLALAGPPAKNLTAVGTASSVASRNSAQPTSIAKAQIVDSNTLQAQDQPPHGTIPTKPSLVRPSNAASKPRISAKKTLVNPNPCSDSAAPTATLATGMKIARPSDAASLLKPAPGKNIIHIKSSGGLSVKSSLPTNTSTHMKAFPKIPTGVGAERFSGNPSVPSSSVVAVSLKPQHASSMSALTSNKSNALTSYPDPVLHSKQQVKPVGETKVSKPDEKPEEQVQGGQPFIEEKEQTEKILEDKVEENEQTRKIREDKADTRNQETELEKQATVAKDPNPSTSNMEVVQTDQLDVISHCAEENPNANNGQVMDSSIDRREKHSEVKESGENVNVNKQSSLSTVTNECTENPELRSKLEAGNGI